MCISLSEIRPFFNVREYINRNLTMGSINETLKDLKTNLEYEFYVLELFKQYSTRIGDERILKELSVIIRDSVEHAIELSKMISKIQSEISTDIFSMAEIVKDVEKPMDKPAISGMLVDFLKEENVMQIMCQRLKETVDDVNIKERIEKIAQDEIKHEKIVRELMDYLSK